MKHSIYILAASTLILASCGGGETKKTKEAKADSAASVRKAIPVSVMEVQPAPFTGYIEIQSQITGDEVVNATPQAGGAVRNILVQVGQKVGKGQLLATIDAAALDQQIKSVEPNVILSKTLYEKQQKLWEQQIGTEVQLLQAKASYESAVAQKAALVAQRNMYRIAAPISGTVDIIDLKVGSMAMPGGPGILIVDMDKMKAQANLGENYLGKVKKGDEVILVFPDIHDSIISKINYVGQAVNPISRAFTVEVKLGNNKKLRPNMSCKMKIANYKNNSVITVPVSVIQKTSDGEVIYVANGNKAKAVMVSTGQNSNGMVEILSGLEAGEKIIVAGFEELDNGAPISIK